nr:hypothetical protein CFP56_05378 [Quercus suber]
MSTWQIIVSVLIKRLGSMECSIGGGHRMDQFNRKLKKSSRICQNTTGKKKYINKLQAIKQNTCDKFHQVEVVSALPSRFMSRNLLELL